jgi:hypothetical protein
MTLYAVHFCSCGWQSGVAEERDLPKSCPTCKRELHQARSPDRDKLVTLAAKGKRAPTDAPSHWSVDGQTDELMGD